MSTRKKQTPYDIRIMQLLGDVIHVHRARQRMGLAELSERCGYSMPYLSELDRGIKEPTITALNAIGAALGVTAGSMLAEAEAAYARDVIVQAEARRTAEDLGMVRGPDGDWIDQDEAKAELNDHFGWSWTVG